MSASGCVDHISLHSIALRVQMAVEAVFVSFRSAFFQQHFSLHFLFNQLQDL
jgi:hypothetical protein